MTRPTWIDMLAAALLFSWLALVITPAIRRPTGGRLKESMRLLPVR
jgi:hypothetical protein